jgi:hypothetical protein
LQAYNSAYIGSKSINLCLPADTACADEIIGSSGTITIATISGSTCNNTTVICTVKTIYDQTGANACGGAACDFTQATIGNRAILIVAGAANGCPTTALPCMTWNGSSATYVISTGPTQAQPNTIIAVANRTGQLTSIQTFFGGNNATFRWQNATNTLRNDAGAVQTIGSISDNAFHVAQMVQSGTANCIIYADGSNSGTGNCGTGGFSGTVHWGDDAGGGLNFQGTAVALWLYPSAFTGTQAGNMNTQLHTNWGF